MVIWGGSGRDIQEIFSSYKMLIILEVMALRRDALQGECLLMGGKDGV
jgi:hypothetical protein